MSYCFVMQPFDKDKYDKRYRDTFAPAIEKCGIETYRVDKDPSVSIPIDTIVDKIKNSTFCFAEISTDNPNVWFELGYAIACEKEIIMVCCSDDRTTSFPFDIRHRNIINYSTASMSDYQELSQNIENKIKAILPKLKNQTNKPIVTEINSDQLSNSEIDLLLEILSLQPVDEDFASIYALQEEMKRKSYSSAATNLAIRKLRTKNMIVSGMECDYNNNEFPAVRLTTDGEKWLINHDNILNLTLNNPNPQNFEIFSTEDDDIPF